MEILVIACLSASAVIHLLPLLGVFGPSTVARMYDVAVTGPDLSVLLVHRAILFGLLGSALVAAIFWQDAREVAIGVVLVSDIAFLIVARLHPGLNDSMKRVVRADAASIGLLVVAGAVIFPS